MLYVYAIIESPNLKPDRLCGHDGEPVIVLGKPPLTAAVSTYRAAEIQPTPDNVLRHEFVLEALMRHHAILPLRFGTIVPTADILFANLAKRDHEYRQILNMIGGKVEIAMHVTTSTVEASPRSRSEPEELQNRQPGSAYLQARLVDFRERNARQKKAEQVAKAVRARLDPLSVASIWNFGESTTSRLEASASYLLERDQVPAFVAAADNVMKSHPDIHARCSGPWAPYSFVSLPRSQEGTDVDARWH